MFEKLRLKIKDFTIKYLCPIYRWFLVKKLRHRDQINVVFFAMSLPMWRHQHLYEKLIEHPKFNPIIVILPSCSYSEEQQALDVKALRDYFDARNVSYILGIQDNTVYDVRNKLDPDILFYPQPYWGMFAEGLAYNCFYDKLLCYTPYAFWTSKEVWSYSQPLQKMSWKLFYSTELHREDAKTYSLVKDFNVEIVGYPTADYFLLSGHIDVWKNQETKKKRIIWAPHFTISSGGLLYQSNFLWMAELMLELTKKYSNKIQFVFKPHPRLYTELCKHPDWGEAKAMAYYKYWETMDNTQIEIGEFVDLFMTSDAMIHDCGSFSVEYHYSENPVMYIAKNFEEQVEDKNNFGKIAMSLHYVGKDKQDIIDFIENVVLRGEDPLKPKRQQFKQDYLLPPNGKTVAENTMDVLIRELC